MRLTFCFSRSCLAYSDALRRRPVLWPCWPGAWARRSIAHFAVKQRVPLRPAFPVEPHLIVLPCRSVIVMSVLLNVAVMCATASASTTFLARLAPAFAVAIYFLRTAFFLPGIARRGPFLVRALVCVRWPRTGRFFLCREPR